MKQDLSKFSNEDLTKALQSHPDNKKTKSLYSFSDDDLKAALLEQEKSEMPFIQKQLVNFAESSIGKTLGEVGSFVDKYTGAPVRAGIYAAQKGESPLRAYVGQFGEKSELAPTGKDIASKAGLSTKEDIDIPGFGEVSPAGIAGLVVDIGADPTNIIPASAIAKGVAKTGGAAARTSAKIAGRFALKGSVAAIESAKKASPNAKLVLEASKSVAKTVANKIDEVVNPKVAPDAKEIMGLAAKYNIPEENLPASFEFGESSVISRAERKITEDVLGQDKLEKFVEGKNKLDVAANDLIKKIGNGVSPGKIDAGENLRKAFKKATDQMLADADTTYNKVWQQNPGLTMSKVEFKNYSNKLQAKRNSLTAFLNRAGSFSTDESIAAKNVVNAIDALKKANGNFKRTYEIMKDVGRLAYGSDMVGPTPKNIQALRDLYSTSAESLMNTAKNKVGGNTAKALELSNGIITDFNNAKKPIGSIIENKNLAPEVLFDRLVKNADSSKIESLKTILAPEDFQNLKAAFLNNYIKNAADEISYQDFKKILKQKKDIMGVMFNSDELQSIAEITKVGDRFGNLTLTTSGPRTPFNLNPESIKSALTNEASLNILKDKARNPQLNNGAVAKAVKKLVDSNEPIPANLQGIAKQAVKENPSLIQQIKKMKNNKFDYLIRGSKIQNIQETNRKER